MTDCACFVVLDEKKVISLYWIVDGITVFNSAETWSSAMLVQCYYKKAGDFPIKKCEVAKLETSTENVNEFLVTLTQRDTPETGFEKFHIAECSGMKTKLEENAFEELAQKLSHVQDFKVAWMHGLPTEVRC